MNEKLKNLRILKWLSFNYGIYWYRFRKNKLSIIGLSIIITFVLMAVFAPWIAPYPSSAGLYTNFSQALQPPSSIHLFGTDEMGRDVLSRVIFGLRYSFSLVGVVLSITVLPGVVLGLIAGYYLNRWFSVLIMRLTDIFVAIPPLLLALSVASLLKPSEINAMMAVTVAWWPWYTRLVYSNTSSLRNEDYVKAAELLGASPFKIMFSEILPNQIGSILTKVSLDAGWVILIGASLSYVGLGAQAPTPDLGTMISEGSIYLPGVWWISIFPAIIIVLIILGFNLLGDGIKDMFSTSIR
ncbi:MAG: ABC transporter permease [Thermoplasmata archaeon]|nr:ABC transporter permease [Thermoplasmata archaeon]MVT14659.1 ABC transporter permease subunit [Euryarchaeota archaeon]